MAEKCYKCGTTENLSIRSQRKNTGYKQMMCKHCRNAYAKSRTKIIKAEKQSDSYWQRLANESRRRILMKYSGVKI